MEIKQAIRTILKWWYLTAALVAVFVAGAYVYTAYYMQNVYESSAVMIISPPRDEQELRQLTLSDYDLNIKLVESYRVLCKTDKILSQVIAEAGLPLTVSELSSKITVASESNTEIIRISAEDGSPERAALIANTVSTVFVREIPQIMRMGNVQMIDKAVPVLAPIAPNKSMIIALSGILGLMASFGLAFLIEYFDVSIKNAEQLSALLGVPVLGTVPRMPQKAGKGTI